MVSQPEEGVATAWICAVPDDLRGGSELTQAERRFAAGMRSPAARRGYLAGRRVLRRIIYRELGIEPLDIHVESRPGGALRLVGVPELHVSISHTGSLVGVALSRRAPVGIDVETVPPRPRSIPDQALSPDKLLALSTLLPSELVPLGAWVTQEAALKADGIGLAFPLQRLAVVADRGWLLVRVGDRSLWHVHIRVFDDAVAAVAMGQDAPRVRWRRDDVLLEGQSAAPRSTPYASQRRSAPWS